MAHKKQILRRVALIAAAVFVAAGVGLLVTAWLYEGWRSKAAARQTRAKEERLAQSRDYLAQVARRIVRLPVDPAVAGDVQSKYLEEYSRTRMYVWAMDTKGEFLFGVPAEEFARINRAYDRHRAEIEQDEYYPDRQAFLRRLIGHEEVDFAAVEGGDETPGWRAYREDERQWPLYSVSIKGENGSVLGTLYMKLEPEKWEPTPHSDTAEAVQMTLAIVTGAAGTLLWFLLPTWVYVDARERGMPRARLWSFLVLISLFIGFLVYLIARPEQPRALPCPGCGREVNGGAFCPHCGHDLSAAFCAACRYPLKPGWLFCPSCRTEIRPPAAPAAPTEASQV
jgi:hypothetical protein